MAVRVVNAGGYAHGAPLPYLPWKGRSVADAKQGDRVG